VAAWMLSKGKGAGWVMGNFLSGTSKIYMMKSSKKKILQECKKFAKFQQLL
jgi:hypothetical protein